MLVKCVMVLIATRVILCSAIYVTEQSQSRGSPRIYAEGGRPVKPGRPPYLVLVETTTPPAIMKLTCSGSIPSATTVLTSLRCRLGVFVTAYAGLLSTKEKDEKNGSVQVRRVKCVATLPLTAITEFNDIMIGYVDQSWAWGLFVRPVALHLSSKSPESVMNCQVMGFGMTGPDSEPGVAHVMDQRIGNIRDCASIQSVPSAEYLLCSYDVEKKTICSGDGGGPAVCDGRQWGLTFEDPSAGNCVPPKLANVYVSIGYYSDWIRKNIKDLPSSADSIHRASVIHSMYEVLLYQPLWLLLLMTVELFHLC